MGLPQGPVRRPNPPAETAASGQLQGGGLTDTWAGPGDRAILDSKSTGHFLT